MLDQMEVIVDKLRLTKDVSMDVKIRKSDWFSLQDVFGDLGSGVGQLVAFVAAAARVGCTHIQHTLSLISWLLIIFQCRCFGIEINPQPARIANKLKEQFEG